MPSSCTEGGCGEPCPGRAEPPYHRPGEFTRGSRAIDEASIVLDGTTVEEYIRDARLALVNAGAFLVLVSSYAVVRVVFDVPYLRASLGLYVAVALAALVAKRRLLHERLDWLVVGAATGFLVNAVVLVLLVQLNRGTLFADVAAVWLACCVAHLVDRAGLARA